MGKLDENGMIHGRVGDSVFVVLDGKQVMKSLPKGYNDKKSDEQLAQRGKFKPAQELYRRLKPAVKGCFEFSKPGQRDYDAFMTYNLLKMYTVSGGSLPTLSYRVEGDRVECEIVASDWSKNDILRFICLSDNGVEFDDVVIASPENTTVTREAKSGTLLAFVHLRDSRKGRLASTQLLISADDQEQM